MNASQTRTSIGQVAARHSQPSVDWAAQIKLAIVLSVVVALSATALAGRLSDSAIVVGAFVVAALVAWRRAEPAPARRPAIVHVRHH